MPARQRELKKKRKQMFNEKLFPVILIVLQIFAAAGYGFCGNWWKALYWFAGFLITIAVTFGMK